MKKSIYIINNDINNKVYIGQAIDVKQRFQAHCKPSSVKNDNDLVAKAIQKYGRQHFTYSILEDNIENYNEREQYWINHYNSIRPNGYNILKGGEEPPRFSGINHPESKFNELSLKELIYDLQYSDMSYSELGNKYMTTKTTVGGINSGKIYHINNLSYPIRKNPNLSGKISDKDVEQIIQMLKYTYLTYEDIGKKYNVEARAIARINKGMYHKLINETYPIRNFANTSNKPKLSYQQVTEIIDLLVNTDLSIRKIAKQYCVELNIIIGIKSGQTKMYRKQELTYPLRKNN